MYGATFRKTWISRSAIDKNPMPRHLFEGNPVDEGKTCRGADSPVHSLEKTVFSTYTKDMSLSKLWEIVREREAWHAAAHGVAKSRTRLSN